MIKKLTILSACLVTSLGAQSGSAPATSGQRGCDTAGLQLPDGFCATVFADSVPGARHVVVGPNGDVFVNTQPPGRGSAGTSGTATRTILAMRDTDRDGKADMQRRFGTGGGTGIALQGNSLYATAGNSILRYRIPSGSLTPTGKPDTIITDLPTTGHRAHNFVLVGRVLYLNVGSRTNACQEQDRQAG